MVFGLAACGGGSDKETSTEAGGEDKQEAADTKDDADEADDSGSTADSETKESTAMVTVKRLPCSALMTERRSGGSDRWL